MLQTSEQQKRGGIRKKRTRNGGSNKLEEHKELIKIYKTLNASYLLLVFLFKK